MYEDTCSRLHKMLNDLPRYSFAQLDHRVPADGVYFLFESGEGGHEGQRIVRIGSHTGKGNLASRLREHVRLNKDRSIFRKHVGRALLQRATIESAVSAYIECNFSVSILGASDSDAACRLEELCIGTVSHCSHCAPSKAWLGRHADPRIAQSGLWQIMHLYGKGLEEADLQGHRH